MLASALGQSFSVLLDENKETLKAELNKQRQELDAELGSAFAGLVDVGLGIRLSLFSTAQPLHTRFPIIFSTFFFLK
jgi:hypothetical protein